VLPIDRRKTVVGKVKEMWVATAVDHQDESVYQMYDCLLSRLKWETSLSGTWLVNSLTQENMKAQTGSRGIALLFL
jgi:hypothetical protein